MMYGPKQKVGDVEPEENATCRVRFLDGSYETAVWADGTWWSRWGGEVHPIEWQSMGDPTPGHPTLFADEYEPAST